MELRALSSLIIKNFPEDLGEHSISPFQGGGIKASVQVVFRDCFWVDDVGLPCLVASTSFLNLLQCFK